MTVLVGDCVVLMGRFPDNFFDAIVTDPPYGLSFMGKKWDNIEYGFHRAWADQAFRVLKPGGHLVSFGGTRTYHRMASAVEDAGFEIRDMVSWLYGQGFPKSMNVGKAIDKAAGEKHGAEQWEGWGTALKPAQEPIVLARKPLIGTVAKNVLEHGTGALNIDASRIGTTKNVPASPSKTKGQVLSGSADGTLRNETGEEGGHDPNLGRWPANVILTHHEDCAEVGVGFISSTGHYPSSRGDSTEVWECVDNCPIRILDSQSGVSKSNKRPPTNKDDRGIPNDTNMVMRRNDTQERDHADSGGASRFFYTAKTSKSERNAGLDHLPDKRYGQSHGAQTDVASGDERYADEGIGLNKVKIVKNNHPTVKPISLMRYLIRLVVPPGGRILDPFLGSGTTGIAAVLEGVNFVGMEMEPEYAVIARARIAYWKETGE